MLADRMKMAAAGRRFAGPAFEFTILTAVEDDTFTLPIYDGGDYDFKVDWGDSSSDIITAWDGASKTHTYEDSGASTYTISIKGLLDGWRFNGAGDASLVKEIQAWGILVVGDLGGYFRGCTNLTVSGTIADSLDTTGMTSFADMFRDCTSLATVTGITGWDTSTITAFTRMFWLATSFDQNLSALDTSAALLMDGMFWGATAFDSSLASWDVSSVTTMAGMFFSTSFNQDISGWTTTELLTTTGMFKLNTAFNQDIDGWDMADVTNLTGMFQSATAFNQDLSNWDTGSNTQFSAVFEGATAFDQDIGGWDITSMETASAMFTGVTLSTANYDALLIGWAGQVQSPNIIFSGGNSLYSAGAATTARTALDPTYGWTITDGGQVP